MSFTSHQVQLMPALATALVVRLVAAYVLSLSLSLAPVPPVSLCSAYAGEWTARLSLLATSEPRAFLADLQDWHSTSSALKAWLGWLGADMLEACRRSAPPPSPLLSSPLLSSPLLSSPRFASPRLSRA